MTTGFIVPTLPVSRKKGKRSVTCKLDVAVAGGGLGGLTLASYLHKHGVNVTVYERTGSFRKFGGPIQVQSNALALLEDIDCRLSNSVYSQGIVTGDRLAAIVDGPTGRTLAQFDTGKTAVRRGLPLTHVIDRPRLQNILAEYVDSCLKIGTPVLDYRIRDNGVDVILENEVKRHDVLIGADGIWSRVRARMHNSSSTKHGANYSGYRCYTATCQYKCQDREKVAYKVVLGAAQYFVCSDVGYGRVQWYAFVNSPEGQDHVDDPLAYLRNAFDGWDNDVIGALNATKSESVEVRDVYDRTPLLSGWSDGGRVTLLGDSSHAMMPNLGQGGGMAIEDAYRLGVALVQEQSVPAALKRYESDRMIRTSIVHGLARTSSDVLKVYGDGGAYPGWNLYWNTVGPHIMKIVMPLLFRYLYVDLRTPRFKMANAEPARQIVRTERTPVLK